MFFDDNLINYIIFIFIFIKIIVLKYNYSCKLIRLFKLIKYVLIYVVCFKMYFKFKLFDGY